MAWLASTFRQLVAWFEGLQSGEQTIVGGIVLAAILGLGALLRGWVGSAFSWGADKAASSSLRIEKAEPFDETFPVYGSDGQQLVVARCVDAHPNDPSHEVGAIEVVEPSDEMKLASGMYEAIGPAFVQYWRVGVVNKSLRTALQNVTIKVARVVPHMNGIHSLPLRLTHDNMQPHQEKFGLAPGEKRPVDVISHLNHRKMCDLHHFVRGVSRGLTFTDGPIEIYLVAHGDGVKPASATFTVMYDGAGGVKCDLKRGGLFAWLGL